MAILFHLTLTLTLIYTTLHLCEGKKTVEPLPLMPAQSEPDGAPSSFPAGDPRRCQEQARESKFDMMRFGVLPGIGWDNLQNLEMGQVVSFNYSLCKVTDDGQYLLPDAVIAVPIKTSYVETFAELIDSYMKTTSSTSNSINVKADLTLQSVAPSGSFSYEHQQIKSKQIENHAVTTRVQLRYKRYDARLQPEPTLTPVFKRRLMSIAANILVNNSALAAYEGELLVRDFGTHVLTSVIAGAGLQKVDFLKRSLLDESSTDKTDILAEASASFFSVFKFSASYKHSTKTDVSKKYSQSTTHSYMTTLGGPLMGANTSLDEWKNGVDNNLVAMDRSGDPLYFLITRTMLPELPDFIVGELEKVVRNSIKTYYEMNTIKGCTKLGSPNFSQSANFEDGTCKSQATNLTFGGVFQTCTVSGHFLNNNPCTNMIQKNPSTGAASCPDHYQPVLMFTGSRRGNTESKQVCTKHGWWIFSHTTCHVENYQATANFQTYWCAATEQVPDHSGYRFGGFFSSRTINFVTGSHSCPPQYYPLNILTDYKICLSDDDGAVDGLPFGGLFTCQTGNPLAVPGVVEMIKLKKAVTIPKPHSLASFFQLSASMKAGNNNAMWPKTCPEGYNQHALTVEEGCAIHFCAKFFRGPVLPPVRRPPYSNAPAPEVVEMDSVVVLNNQTWETQQLSGKYVDQVDDQSHDGLSVGSAAGLGVGITLTSVVVAVVVIALVAKRRKMKQREYRPLPSHANDDEQRPIYGTGAPTDVSQFTGADQVPSEAV